MGKLAAGSGAGVAVAVRSYAPSRTSLRGEHHAHLAHHRLLVRLGRALAEEVIAAGHGAVVTARDASTVSDLVALAPDRVLGAALDVTDPARAAAVVQQAEDRFGAVDVLVNNGAARDACPAVEGTSGSLRAELQPLGISVTVVAPGGSAPTSPVGR